MTTKNTNFAANELLQAQYANQYTHRYAQDACWHKPPRISPSTPPFQSQTTYKYHAMRNELVCYIILGEVQERALPAIALSESSLSSPPARWFLLSIDACTDCVTCFDEEGKRLGYNAVQCGSNSLMFWRNILPQSSESSKKRSSQIPVGFYRTVQRYSPEDGTVHSQSS